VDDDGGGGRARAEPDRVGGPVGGPLDPPEGGGGRAGPPVAEAFAGEAD
jgi:hypothetical protein